MMNGLFQRNDAYADLKHHVDHRSMLMALNDPVLCSNVAGLAF